MNRQRIKILFLIDELLIGGTENQLILLTENLPRDSFDSVIGVLHRTDYQKTLKIKTPIVDFKWSGTPFVKNLFLLRRLKNYLEKERVDILQTHFADSTIYGAWAVRLCRHRPYLITTRRNLYHWVKEEPWSFRFLRYSVRWTDQILVNSYSAFKECQKMEGVPPEKITFIPNAIEVGRFNGISTEKAKKSIGLAGKFPVIGVVGNFRPVKGLVSFIEAAAEVYREIPTARFVLVGKGLQEEELRGRARDLGIQERVLFLKDYSDIPAVMAAFDVAVQPSLSESFSNVLLEYMASSKPIVATRVGDTEIVIEDGREGLLVKPNGPEELSAAILSLCKNRGKADEMGKLARVKVETNWSLSKILDTYEQFYKNLVLKNK